MAYRTIAFQQEDYPMYQHSLQPSSNGYRLSEQWEHKPDGYYVYSTTTEWMPPAVDAPRYPSLHTFFHNNLQEGHGNGYASEERVPEVVERDHVKKSIPMDAEKVHVEKHVQFEKTDGHNRKVHKENVDMEADDFIKRKHKAFGQSKLMSMQRY